MKKILYRIISALAAVAVGLVSVGCGDDVFEEIKEMDLSRCLRPMNLSAKITRGNNVTFSWDVTKDAEFYTLVVCSDEAMTNEVVNRQIPAGGVPVTIELDPDASFWFKVQAGSSTRQESKWAEYDNPVKTYAVKDPLYLKVTGRESQAVTLSWSTEVADYLDVTHIEYSVSGSAEEVKSITLSEEDKAAGTAKVSGLAPSTEYVITLCFASASRGDVDVWTMPDTSAATPVSTSAALEQAMRDGAVIFLKMEGSPYIIGGGNDAGLDVTKGFKIYGESSADGTRPVIIGAVSIAPDFDGGDIYFEGVDFSGNKNSAGHPICLKNGATGSLVPVNSIIYKNCGIYGYSKGLIYEWNQTFKLGELSWDSCDIYEINADGSGGGDVIDFRGASEVGSLNLVNSTIRDGMRTFIRIDNGVWGKINILNNTMRNLCVSDNTNNAGIIAVNKDNGTTVGEMSVKGNLFLDMPEKATLGSGTAKYYSASDMSVAVGNNWFFNCPESFSTANFNVADFGKTLEADPCYNAAGGYFNLIAGSDVAAAKAGAPKWWIAFVEEPEDLTLNALEGAKVWDFSNAKYFTGDVKKSMVRDGLLMVATEDLSFSVADGVLNANGSSVLNRKGVPVNGYLAFKVDTKGSVVVKPTDPAALGNHVVVAVGDVDGGAVRIKGGASAQADMDSPQKILITDIAGESLVYVYTSGPVGIADLAWSLDTLQVNTALPTPSASVKPSSVTAGEAKELTVTWDPVINAGSYSVVFSGKTYSTDETSFVIGTDVVKMLDPGSYLVNVFANPGENDIYNTQSSAAAAAFAVLPAGGGAESAEFVVSSVDDLLSAISAGKTDITLAYNDTPYAIGQLSLSTPLHLKGQTVDGRKTPVTASFTLSGEIGGSVILENLEVAGDGASFVVDDKNNAPVADTVAIINSYLHGTKALYDNSGKAASNVDYLIIDGNVVEDCSAGADFIDLRAGAHHNLLITNNTFANSCRTFIRTDAGHEMNYATVSNNTFYKVATNAGSKDNNGIFHIRSAAGAGLLSYQVKNNLFYSILIDETPGNANGFPKLRSKGGISPSFQNNYYFNCEDREDKAEYSFWSFVTKDESLAGGGAILGGDPCKDASKYDFTLTNGVAMNAGVGDPRWNPMAGSRPSSEISVSSVEELLTAISAGKSTITLDDGQYDFTAVTDHADISSGKLKISNSLNLMGSADAVIVGGFQFDNGVDRFTVNGITLNGAASVDNALYVMDNTEMSLISLKNCRISGFKNRLIYQDKETSAVASLEINGAIVTDMGTGGDFIDFRKGALSAVKVANSTFANGIRTFARVDAAVKMSSALIENNTFYNIGSVDSKDNNGILHFRSSSLLADSRNFMVRKNIFAGMHRASEAPANANGFPKLVSTGSSSLGHPTFAGNYYYDIEEEGSFSWWNTIGSEEPLAGGGIVLSSDPFKNAAGGDFTLVNALAASEKVGDPRWISGAGQPSGSAFKVNNVEELLTAVSAGKTNILLAYGTYDLTAAEDAAVSSGIWTVTGELLLKGQSSRGQKPVLIGGFKPAGTNVSFALEGLKLVGAYGESKIGNMIDVDAAAVLTGLSLKDCDITSYGNRLVSASGASTIGPAILSGLTVSDMGTGGDFFDVRKGSIASVSITGSTFYNGIRTFIRIDAGVDCGAVTVRNNTFFNIGAVDSKDNNGIMHVRSTKATSDPRQIIVEKNVFAGMHRAVETPANAAAGFPHLISKGSAAIAVPSFKDNLFWDIETEAPYSWWTYLPEDYVTTAGTVLSETPFSGDPAAGKFSLIGAYKGYGDLRW